MKKEEHPCKKDCPDRTAECRKVCLKYFAYEQQYLKAKSEFDEAAYAVVDYQAKKSRKIKKIINRGRKYGKRPDRKI